ncbi:MAG TPA: IclR family transcriptional regulator [Nakamurella sp.]|nr:IclR family transcriptional regulator [Nakamurella sp.]
MGIPSGGTLSCLLESNARGRADVKAGEADTLNSIEKALAVLRVLAMPNQPHRLAEIAEKAEVGKTTAHRVLQVLVANNYAHAHGDGMYSAGPALAALSRGLGAEMDLAQIAEPALNELQRMSGHTVHFAVRTGRVAVYLAKVEGSKPYQMASRVGMQIPLHCTAIGKSVLAHLPEAELGAVLEPAEAGAGSVQLTADRMRALRADLAAVRERGYAIDDEENEPNVRCVGAPVRGPDGTAIGGISVSGLAFILTLEQAHELGPQVIAYAQRVSAALGYRAPVVS